MSREKVREAAAVVAVRDGPDGPLVLLGERAPTMRFLGGFWAFPGGGRSRDDADLVETARRELAEETGLVLDAKEARRRLRPAARFLTPPFSPVRFDTVFFRLDLRDEEEVSVRPPEFTGGGLVAPREAVEAWLAGRMRIAPPVLFVLEAIAERGLEEGLDYAARRGEETRSNELPDVRFVPGVTLAATRTDTVPPAVATNGYLVGVERVVVVDPAPSDEEEAARLERLVERRLAAGGEPAAVLLTHWHRDHVGAVERIRRRFDLPVAAHPYTLERLGIPASQSAALLGDEEIDLGRTPDGAGSWRLSVHATPGHARGHLSFTEDRFGGLFAGDLVSTLSTIVVDPPDGHLATYLESLERMASLAPRIVLPSHGPPALDGPGLLRKFQLHRKERERKLLDALGEEERSPAALLAVVYDDVDESLKPWAARSLAAGLEKLIEEGRIEERAGGFAKRRDP